MKLSCLFYFFIVRCLFTFSERQTTLSRHLVCAVPGCVPWCLENNSKQGAGTGLSVFIQLGEPESGVERPAGSTCLQGASRRRLSQADAEPRSPRWFPWRRRFCSQRVRLSRPAEATAAKRPAACGSRSSGLSVNGVRTNAFA